MITTTLLLQFLGGITLIVWFSIAGLSLTTLFAEKSSTKILKWAYLVGIYAYPIIVGICYWRSWEYIGTGDSKPALIFSTLPILIFLFGCMLLPKKLWLPNQTKGYK